MLIWVINQFALQENNRYETNQVKSCKIVGWIESQLSCGNQTLLPKPSEGIVLCTNSMERLQISVIDLDIAWK